MSSWCLGKDTFSPTSSNLSDVVRTSTHLRNATDRRYWLNQYIRGARVGKGKHGEVFLCRDEEAGLEVAVKVVKRSNPRDRIKLLRRNHQKLGDERPPALSSTEHSIRKEIAVMKKCRHTNIVRLFEVIDDPQQDKIYMVMEYLPGGEVQWTDEHHQPVLTVFQTRRIIRDVLVGLEYLHHHGIIHRDIKPANLLWTQDRSCIKIADFGVSHFNPITRDHKRLRRRAQDFQNDSNLFPESDLLKRAGTPSFLAPEVVWFCDYGVEPLFSTASLSNSSETDKVTFNQLPTRRPSITKAIDVWSLAITFYCLLFGHTPFNTSDANDNIHHTEYMLYHLICTQDWTVDQVMGADRVLTGGRRPKDRESGGYVVIRLLDQMLQKNPDNRPTVGELKSHSWFLRDMANSEEWLRDTSPTVGSTPCRGWIERIGRKLLPRSMRTP